MTTLPTSPPATPRALGRALRWVLACLGVVCVGIGAVGVFVPGLPTTVFLLIASWCFVRSCPWLEAKLLRNRLFEPYMKFIDSRAPMPLRARVTAIVVMWVFVSVSLVMLASRGWVGACVAVAVAAGVGTAFIALWRRNAGRA